MIKQLITTTLVLLATICFSAVYATSPIYKTNDHDPTYGYDVSKAQKVALRFSPPDDLTLNHLELWFMNNATALQGMVTISIYNDKVRADGQSEPGDEILEKWTFQISSHGWEPKKELLFSKTAPVLVHDQRYWVVAESSAIPKSNPVWNATSMQGNDTAVGYYGRFEPGIDQWEVGYSSIPTIRIYGNVPTNANQ